MSKFSEKVFRGEKPTDEEWADHLIEAHSIAPSMTPHAFANYKSKDGISSYEFLAKAVTDIEGPGPTILDLACGDGYLIQFVLPKIGDEGSVIGIDMSEAELAVAKKTYTNS